MHAETKSLSCYCFINSADLEEHAAGLHNCYPVINSAFTGTHTGLSRFCRNRFIRENFDPDFAATLHVTGHRNTGCLDLV